MSLVFVGLTAGCTCGEVKTTTVGKMVLKIDSPDNGAIFQTGETFDYHATANDLLGIKSIELRAGGVTGVAEQTLQTCTGEAGMPVPRDLTCDFSFEIDQHKDLIANGQITLTAVAFDRNGLKTNASIVVRAKPLIVRFKVPSLTPDTDPPVARVSGSSQLVVEVVATNGITAVGVTDEAGQVVAKWPNNPTAPFSKTIIWTDVPGVGTHTLTAIASDDAGNVDSATLALLVSCKQDSDCLSNEGTRCCVQDGMCHQMVGENQDCDCAHPCPLDQGCFPGICGATPQKCRPGCKPAGPPDNTHPYGIAAERCPRQDGKPAYCSPLPAGQATEANKGGACAVGDDCDVAAQNCADLPLDRTQPPGPSNPPVPQTCAPVAPATNACQPSGGIAPWGINCDQACGATANNCAQGYECVSIADGSGRQIGPSECRKQCSHPGIDPSPDCPRDHSACEKVYVPGMVYLSTGVCQEGPCFSNADCRGFPATPCCNTSNICDACH
jgi:hypothetical protein